MAWPFECPGPPGQVPGLPTLTRSRARARTIRLSAKNGGGMVTVASRARGPGPYPVPVESSLSTADSLVWLVSLGHGRAEGPLWGRQTAQSQCRVDSDSTPQSPTLRLAGSGAGWGGAGHCIHGAHCTWYTPGTPCNHQMIT